MQDDKATAWLTLADADAIEQKVLNVLGNALNNPSNQHLLADHICNNYNFQMRIKALVEPTIRQTISDEMQRNFKIDHYYEQWNRTVGYRIRYGNTVIQTEQIKLGF
jgi:hypothetical protein